MMFRTLFPVLLCIGVLSSAQGVAQVSRTTAKKNPKDSAVAVINGVGIPYRYYEQLRDDQTSYQIRTLRATKFIDPSVDDQLFLQLVDEELIQQGAKKLGITVSEQQAMEELIGNPPDFIKAPFIDEKGTFRSDIFSAVVRDPKLIAKLIPNNVNVDSAVRNWRKDIEKTVLFIRSQMIRDKYTDALYAKSPLSESKIRSRYYAEKTLLDGSFIRVLHSTIPDTLIPVTDAEARAYYNQHKDDYRLAPSRTISTVIFPIPLSASDSAVCRARMDSVRKAIRSASDADRNKVLNNIRRTLLPDRLAMRGSVSLMQVPQQFRDDLAKASVGDIIGPVYDKGEAILLYVSGIRPSKDTLLHVRHVLMKYLNEDSLNNGLERFMQVLGDSCRSSKNGDSIFIQAAHFYSADGTKDRGGDLGYIARGKTVPSFDSAAFGAEPGMIVGPIRTSYGFHLIRVVDRVTKNFELRELRFPLEVSEQSRQRSLAEIRAFARLMHTKTPLDSALRSMRVKYPQLIADTSAVRQMEPYGDVIAISSFAFGANVDDVALVELPFDRYAAVKLINYWNGGTPPFDSISAYPYAHARRTKQLDALKPAMDMLADSLKPEMLIGPIRSIAPMAEIFVINNQLVTPPPDEETTILDTLVATTRANSTSRWVRGKHAYYFLRVVQRSSPSEEDYQRNKAAFTKLYTERYRRQLLDKALADARAFATFKDLRPTAKAPVIEVVK